MEREHPVHGERHRAAREHRTDHAEDHRLRADAPSARATEVEPDDEREPAERDLNERLELVDHRAFDEPERMRTDRETEADELDPGRQTTGGAAAADDQAPHVGEEQEAHQERDRAHVSSGLALASSTLRAVERPRPTPSFASAS